MADYRELLRKAIDALPENTGANRRAVYEKARSALVAQLRAIEPPLPAREITTHRLNLEDCIREVEHEATEKLLGRFRAVEEPEPEAELEPVVEQEPYQDEREAEEPYAEDEPYGREAEFAEQEIEPEPEAEPDNFEAPPAEDLEPEPEVEVEQVEPRLDDGEAEAIESEPVWQREDEPAFADDDDRFESAPEVREPDIEPELEDELEPQTEPGEEPQDDVPLQEETQSFFEPVPETPDEEPAPYRAGSIEDIIASAERAAQSDDTQSVEPVTPEEDDNRVVPFSSYSERSAFDLEPVESSERHFILSEADAEPRSAVSLVDLHGRPLVAAEKTSEPETAMSSVREVDLEPGIIGRPEISDAQVAIDRAIAALDREARGEPGEASEAEQEPAENTTQAGEAGEERRERSGGFGAFTIFLVISVLLLGGGGVAGYWAWREGYIDLNALFAQGESQPTTEVAEAQVPETPVISAPEDTPVQNPATNTTPDVPTTNGEVSGSTMPGENLPFTETETPSTGQTEPEATFEDRLPAEAETPIQPDAEMLEEPGIALSTEGAQSLLLEEQTGGSTGAVPYSGSVEWSRGTDELGHPTIIADASIPARNLEVEVLLRRNADANLPASHLMEVNFTVAESFIGGSIANLPGVLLKDEELVQGQPLTGASARIVGNSFLFALSSASDIDVENNIELLTDRAWVDLAMVYGTGRRAILTLEKGEDGEAIFEDVLAAWSTLDAEAATPEEDETAPAADEAAPAGEATDA